MSWGQLLPSAHCRLRGAARRLLCGRARVWVGAAGLVALAAHAIGPPAPIALRQAEFVGQPSGATTTVALPDTWAQRGLPVSGAGRYTLRFTLAAAPEQPWAASFARISASRRITLNGVAIEDDLDPEGRRPISRVVPLPAPLLRLGENTLEVEVSHRFRGGLSDVRVGPAAELRHRATRSAVWTEELPRSLNMGMALLAVFLLLLRWRRPSERAMGLFGAFTLLGSVRNYSYLMDIGLLHSHISDWFFFSAQVWAAALFALFALSLHAQRRRGVVERFITTAAIALPIGAALATPFGGLTLLRTGVYPLLLLGAAVSLGVVWQAMRKSRTPTNVALMGGFSVLIAASLHDYAFQQGHLPVTGTFWVPYVMPFALGIYGLLLIERFVRATSEVERLNIELEHRVQQRTRALQSANAAKTRFLASASHDLRQPVAAIGLMVSLLREQLTTPALRKMIDRVDEALASMEGLLKGLLDLSRLEAGTARARPQRVAVQALFDAIALHETESAERKGLRLRFRPTRLAVQSDPVLLEQVLRNLISNAVRYTERGGVLVAARGRQGQVLLQVWDSGIGIADADQASVFEEFVQLDNAARESARGFGLGLSIVRRSTRLLGHELTLRSVLGRGSCFSLVMPRASEAAPPAPAADVDPQPLRGLRIVLVEDDPVMRETLGERLTVWGAQVTAFDGVPSLRAALPPRGAPKNGRFTDLLITDQRLPGGSGLLVIELVRQRCGATRAMVVTGDTAPGDLTLLASTGVPVLHKPFRAEALLVAIRQALQSTPLGEFPE
jgi:signal transduction histidine kinase/ActR/RegA family two-component response regulator